MEVLNAVLTKRAASAEVAVKANGHAEPEAVKPALTGRKLIERDRHIAWLHERIIKSRKEPVAEVVTLVPGLAELLLERNPVNRPIAKKNAADLAADIANGRFEFNGESIVVSNTGVLLDGQHRCGQVIATGVPIQTVIVFGPKESARFTIDIGKTKTVGNFLAMKGRAYSNVLAGVASFHLQYRTLGKLGETGHERMPTKAEVLAIADEVKGIDQSVEFTVPAMKTVRNHAVLAFCHSVFWKKATREAADEFILRLIEGDGLRKGDPILYCRNRLIATGRGSLANARAELIFKCWNASRLGHGITHFKLTGGKLPKVER